MQITRYYSEKDFSGEDLVGNLLEDTYQPSGQQ